jgi:hypothetical protein
MENMSPTPRAGYFTKDKTKVPGVTTVIAQLGWNKQQLMWWANQEGLAGRSHRDTADKAASAGTCGHYLVDCEIHGIKPDTSQFQPEILEKGETAYLNFLQWRENFKLEVVTTEIQLVSEIYRFGGTPDCIAKVNGKLALLDWKTGNSVYADHKIQLPSYRQLWEENFPNHPLVGGYHLLRIDKDSASFAHYYWHELTAGWEAFKHLLALYNLQKELK